MTPAALNVGDFANGRVRLYETRIQRQSPYIHIPFKDLELPDEILAAMIFRDHQMIIPTAMTACSLTTTLTSSARRKI